MHELKFAQQCFQENIQKIGDPSSEPDAYNLNRGLLALAKGTEQDHEELKQLFSKILLEIQRRP
jgi:hypothetical protein